jgi:phospho-N-acetylmuramoyl-pentapeptide-transferase
LNGQLAFYVLIVIAVGLSISLLTCAIVLPLFRRMKLGQRVYEDAPASHQKKMGTPTMGGLCFVFALAPLMYQNIYPGSLALAIFALVAACAAVGFADDIMAIRLGRNRGLRARTKFLLTALIAVMFLRAVSDSFGMFPRDVLLYLPAAKYALIVPHWLWFILGVAAITATIHAVNLTDGLDGLATGAMLFPLLAFGTITITGLTSRTAVSSYVLNADLLGLGACLGFLLYNRYPAKLIMGDTGSLALGALLSGIAILSGEMLLLIVVAGVFVAETLSVMLQVVYFKLTHGKRIFKMSPLHHHFELLGWPETKVTTRFWIASAVCSAVGLAIVR